MKRQNLRGRVPFALAISALMATNIVSPAHADNDVWDEEGDEIISEKPREGDLKGLKDLFDGGESPKNKPKDSQPKPEDKPKGTPESKKEHNDGADVWGEDDEVPLVRSLRMTSFRTRVLKIVKAMSSMISGSEMSQISSAHKPSAKKRLPPPQILKRANGPGLTASATTIRFAKLTASPTPMLARSRRSRAIL